MSTYSAGTLSVTNGLTTVTITGGASIPENMKPDDRIEIDGAVLPNAIASLTDAAHFELARAYDGATGDKDYMIWNMPSGWGDRVELAESVAATIRTLRELARPSLIVQTAAFVYDPSGHLGKVIILNSAAERVVTLPANAEIGDNFSLIQIGNGPAKFTAAAGASLVSIDGDTRTLGHEAYVSLLVRDNNAGRTAAKWLLSGVTAP